MHFKEKKLIPQKKEKKKFSSNFWLFLLHPVSILPCLLLHTKMFHQSAVVIEEILKLFKIIIILLLKIIVNLYPEETKQKLRAGSCKTE